MATPIDKSLVDLSTLIKDACNGDSAAQKKVGEIFSAGKTIKQDKQIADFWLGIANESKSFRTTRHPLPKFNRPLNFLSVENDYARDVRVSSSVILKEKTEQSLLLVEEHKKRTTYTYMVDIKKYASTRRLLAMMGGRAVFGWTSSEVRSKFASFPCRVSVDSLEKAKAAVEELGASAVTAEIIVMNGLGEDVTKGGWEPASLNAADSDNVRWPKFCNKCGNKLTPSMKFCNNCGSVIKPIGTK